MSVEPLREQSETLHISDVDEETRSTLRRNITAEIEDSFRVSGVEADVVKYLGGKPRGFTVLGRHRARRRI